MTQSDMANKGGRKPNRIPVRFVGDEEGEQPECRHAGREPDARRTRATSPLTTTRPRWGGASRAARPARRARARRASAGSTDPSELPRSRNEQDTTVSHVEPDERGGGGASGTAQEPARNASAGAGPQVAELIATRAELRRVEAELKKLTGERQDLNDNARAPLRPTSTTSASAPSASATETYNRALGEVVRRLLPVLDNLQRALDAEHVVEVKESEEFRHFLQGVELINRQLGGVLEGLGVEVVPTVGERFDPHVHEAVATEETAAHEPDTVTQEMQRGYRLGDKLLRPAMVKVATRG